MTPLIFNLGPMELVIILVIVLLLFGGSRLAGLGKSTGRAIKEFKEETRTGQDAPPAASPVTPPSLGGPPSTAPGGAHWQQPPASAPVDQPESDVRRDA